MGAYGMTSFSATSIRPWRTICRRPFKRQINHSGDHLQGLAFFAKSTNFDIARSVGRPWHRRFASFGSLRAQSTTSSTNAIYRGEKSSLRCRGLLRDDPTELAQRLERPLRPPPKGATSPATRGVGRAEVKQ
jgi:hypothetical protein